MLLLIRVCIHLGSTLDPTPPDPCGLGAVVNEAFPEPRMPECLLGGKAFGRVVDEDFLEKVEKLLVEEVGGGNDVLNVILVLG